MEQSGAGISSKKKRGKGTMADFVAAAKRSYTLEPRILSLGDDELILLGTAHVSPESVADVEQAISEFQPDQIAVELCPPRYETLADPERWRKLDLSALVRQKKMGLLASSLILSAFQKKIGESTGSKPGAEMLAAIERARGEGAVLHLVDREVRTTLSRAWRRVGLWSKLWLSSSLLASLLVRDDVDPEEIERLKHEDVLSDLFANLPRRYDSVKDVIIDERDDYMALAALLALRSEQGAGEGRRLDFALDAARSQRQGDSALRRTRRKKGAVAGKRMLVVVGAGHLRGLVERLEALRDSGVATLSESLARLAEPPPPNKWKSIGGWVLFASLMMLVSYAVSQGGKEAAAGLAIAWILGRSIGAGVGALLARAHPLTIVVTVVMAPISPFLLGTRLWMYSLLTELWLRKPRVEDFENIADDTAEPSRLFRALYSNRVLKLFWMITLISFGSAAGYMHFFTTLFSGLR